MTTAPSLVLASGSRYRRQLLERLGLPFDWRAPEVDESQRAEEAPAVRALRLAREKARAVAEQLRGPGLVIGSDQVAALGGQVLDKPGSLPRARRQLRASSGATVGFHTAVVLLHRRDGEIGHHVDLTRVRFRTLADAEIDRYLEAERPLDCAGSFKVEALGISLFRSVHSEDPTALVGLPLIALADLLRGAGWAVP